MKYRWIVLTLVTLGFGIGLARATDDPPNGHLGEGSPYNESRSGVQISEWPDSDSSYPGRYSATFDNITGHMWILDTQTGALKSCYIRRPHDNPIVCSDWKKR